MESVNKLFLAKSYMSAHFLPPLYSAPSWLFLSSHLQALLNSSGWMNMGHSGVPDGGHMASGLKMGKSYKNWSGTGIRPSGEGEHCEACKWNKRFAKEALGGTAANTETYWKDGGKHGLGLNSTRKRNVPRSKMWKWYFAIQQNHHEDLPPCLWDSLRISKQ